MPRGRGGKGEAKREQGDIKRAKRRRKGKRSRRSGRGNGITKLGGTLRVRITLIALSGDLLLDPCKGPCVTRRHNPNVSLADGSCSRELEGSLAARVA